MLNLLPIGKPFVLALVTDTLLTSGNELMAYEPLRKELGAALGRNVYLELCLPLQGGPCLRSGLYHAAVVSPAQYARFSRDAPLPVLAVSADSAGRVARSALLVVASGTEFQTVADLRGKRIAFGPQDDGRTHLAALRLLARHGLAKTDLSLEVFPVPGSPRHFPDMRAIAQSVIGGGSDAGFLDEAAWEALPEHDQRAEEPARDKLRVLAKTAAVPDRLVVGSPKLDEATRNRIQSFLLATGRKHPQVLRPLRLSGFREPSKELLAACRRLVAGGESGESTP